MVSLNSKVQNSASSVYFFYLFILIFFIIILRSGRLDENWWSFVSQNPIGVFASHFLEKILGCVYTTCSYDQASTSCSVPCRSLPTQSCLALYSFHANLLSSLIMWLIVSSLSPTWSTSAVLLHLIFSPFDMVSPYGIVFLLLLEEIQFPSKGFSSHFCFLVIVDLLDLCR